MPRTVVEPDLCTTMEPFRALSACFGSVVVVDCVPLGSDFERLAESNLSHCAPGLICAATDGMRT